jgi:hypothetical protein
VLGKEFLTFGRMVVLSSSGSSSPRMVLYNVRNHSPYDTVSHPRRLESSVTCLGTPNVAVLMMYKHKLQVLLKESAYVFQSAYRIV